MSLYEDLGLAPDATADEIKAAHRRAARKHHPDAGGDRDEFERVQRAALVLRDPAKRAKYDRDGTIEDAADTGDSAAIGLLVGAFDHALSQSPDIAIRDIIALTKSALNGQLTKYRRERVEAEQTKTLIVAALSRLGHAGRLNVLGRHLGMQLSAVDDGLAQIALNEAAAIRAIELADEYTWRVDQTEIQWAVVGGPAGNTNTGWTYGR